MRQSIFHIKRDATWEAHLTLAGEEGPGLAGTLIRP